MRALVYNAPGKVDMEDRPRPHLEAGDTEIAIEVAGVCGSDISGFLGHSARRQPPLVLGHELVGRRANGSRVVANPLISCGRCSACHSGAQNLCTSWRLLGMDQTPGSFAEFVAVPSAQIYEIPDHLPSTRAVLTEPLANIVHLFGLVNPPPFFKLAIVGAGTMGALALLTAQTIGVQEVLMVDVNEQRLATALEMGANAAIDVRSSEGREQALKLAAAGFDVVLDASGSAAARQMAFDLCRPGGQVVLLGMGQQRSEVDFVSSIRREIRVVMSFAYTPADFERALALLIAGKVDLTQWTAQMPLERGQQALDTITQAPGAMLKMLLGVDAHYELLQR
jgi:2-desacetyl-2-hydroxyethyl bacteriochlorophyllide A dehydrogenase